MGCSFFKESKKETNCGSYLISSGEAAAGERREDMICVKILIGALKGYIYPARKIPSGFYKVDSHFGYIDYLEEEVVLVE